MTKDAKKKNGNVQPVSELELEKKADALWASYDDKFKVVTEEVDLSTAVETSPMLKTQPPVSVWSKVKTPLIIGMLIYGILFRS